MMDYVSWAKQHKKEKAAEFIARFKPDSMDKPLAIFMAGIPGAGKTEFLDRLLEKEIGIVRIDLDSIVELFPNYKPERYYEYRAAANIILEAVYDACRHASYNFVLDGTFGHAKTLENVTRALKRHQVALFYIWQEPRLAWHLTQDREIVTHRAISLDGFINACVDVPNKVKQALKEHGGEITVVAIRKDSKHHYEVIKSRNEIDELLLKTYTKEELEDML